MLGPPSRLAFTKRRLAQLFAREGTDIILHWLDTDGLTQDPVSQTWPEDTPTETATIRGLIHATESAAAHVDHLILEKGGLVVDVPADAALEGKTGLEFEIQGQRFVQAKDSRALPTRWTTTTQGEQLIRTVLLQPKP